MTLSRRATLLGAGAGLALRTTGARAEDTLKIGVVSPLTGPAAESGQFKQNGMQLALDAVNAAGGVLGKKLELVVEDDQTTNPGAVLAFSRLAGRDDIVAFIGPVRSTQVNSMAPDVLKAGKVMMIGGTDPSLTHLGNPWLFRCRPNDTYSAQVIAQFGVKELNKRKWAVVFSTDTFGSNGNKALTAALEKEGIQPVLAQGYTNQQADFTPVVLAVRQSGADILSSYFTYENDLGVFARQVRQLGVRIPWVGSPSIANTTSLNLAGPALYGTYGVSDFSADASPAAKAYAEKYQAAYKSMPDIQSSWAFDAVNILAMAINAAKSTDPQAMRKAVIAIKGYGGAEGEYNFDENGDGLHGYNIVRNDNGKIVFDRHIELTA
ncbi:MAG: ABC transporter substrate-binding protein [Acetobacteraceae bacterium]|nr:ABC transporter substrate-binding protein [Acetobacteraceae bacterium]